MTRKSRGANIRRRRRRRANRTYKDRLFIRIFEHKEDLLSLYNAVNGSDYQNPDELEITTLDNAIYMRMKNDISFLIDGYMSLYEHQSTFNPNMEKCPKLYEYSYLVAKIRENQSNGKTLEGAIEAALEDCLAQGYLTELLTTYRREVTGMLLYEYDERKHLKNTYEEGIQKGMRTGQYKGRQQKAYQAARNLYRRGFSIKDTAGILEEDEKMVAAWYKKWETKRGR